MKNPLERKTKSHVDTISFTKDEAKEWELPPFQRPLRVNDKVREIATLIGKDGGVIPGIITMGVIEKRTFLLDGQHRREAFLLSDKDVGYADVRICQFDNIAEMGEEFVNLNSHLVSLRPDDVLRGLEGSLASLQKIRKQCPFVGYDSIRRNDSSPVVSMSGIIRCWASSQAEVPGHVGMGAASLAKHMTEEDTQQLIRFLTCAMKAWGRDEEYARLWTAINTILCMWLYRRLVITPYSPKTPRLEADEFQTCLMALSANAVYLDWLVGRRLGEHDRAPAYRRIKDIFSKRLEEETGRKSFLPAPAWAHGK